MRPLVVVALGGNAVSPPAGDLSYATERDLVGRAIAEIAPIARSGARLLLVHGNGPQVGRLLAAGGVAHLDVHVAQTQGELGYLLAEALERRLAPERCVAIVTRVLVDAEDPAFEAPAKPVGPVLAELPAEFAATRTPDGRGWRRVVASPRPRAIVELEAIRTLLATQHVVAGGGGGVALAAGDDHAPCAAVVDKDWLASLAATALDASELVFVTDVAAACDDFGTPGARPIGHMDARAAKARLAAGVFHPGSMEPKIESAIRFVEATGRRAVITTIGEVERARFGMGGTILTR